MSNDCPRCSGEGIIFCDVCLDFPGPPKKKSRIPVCHKCSGAGELECPDCEGQGVVEVDFSDDDEFDNQT